MFTAGRIARGRRMTCNATTQPSKPYLPRATGASLQPAQELRSSRPAGMQLKVPLHEIPLGKPHCRRVYIESCNPGPRYRAGPKHTEPLRRAKWTSLVGHVRSPSGANKTGPSGAKVAQVAKEEMEHAAQLPDTNRST